MKLPIVSNGALVLSLALGACSGMPSAPVQKNEFAPPTDLAGAIRSAQLQRHNGDADGAIRTLSQLMLVAPDDPRVLGEYGKVLVDKGQSSDALAFLGRAIELQPGDWMLFSAQGVAYSQAGNYEAAQVAFARSLQLNPDEPTVLNNEALAYLQTGNLDGAENLLLRATPNAPGYARIQQNLAMVQHMKESHRPVLAAPVAPVAPAIAAAAPVEPVRTAEAEQAPVATIAPAPQALAASNVVQVEPAVAAPAVVTPPVPFKPAANVPPPAASQAAAPVAVAKSAPRIVAAKPAVAPAPVATAPAVSSPTARFVQISAFYVEDQATRAATKLNTPDAHVFRGVRDGRTVFRVRLGPFANLNDAKSALGGAQTAGYGDAMLVTDSVEPVSPKALALAKAPASLSAPTLRLSQNSGVTSRE